MKKQNITPFTHSLTINFTRALVQALLRVCVRAALPAYGEQEQQQVHALGLRAES